MNFNILARKQAEKEAAEAQRDRAIRFKRVFGTPEGKEVLCELMDEFHIIRRHRGDSFDEGQRSVVTWIMEQTHMDLAALDRLMRGEESA